jgi:hypothetical protein
MMDFHRIANHLPAIEKTSQPNSLTPVERAFAMLSTGFPGEQSSLEGCLGDRGVVTGLLALVTFSGEQRAVEITWDIPFKLGIGMRKASNY